MKAKSPNELRIGSYLFAKGMAPVMMKDDMVLFPIHSFEEAAERWLLFFIKKQLSDINGKLQRIDERYMIH